MCSKHVEAWNKLIIKFSGSNWLILRNKLFLRFQSKLKCLDRFSKKIKQYQISWKYVLVGTEMFHAEWRTGRHDDANSRFSQFCESAQRMFETAPTCIVGTQLQASSCYITNKKEAVWIICTISARWPLTYICVTAPSYHSFHST